MGEEKIHRRPSRDIHPLPQVPGILALGWGNEERVANPPAIKFSGLLPWIQANMFPVLNDKAEPKGRGRCLPRSKRSAEVGGLLCLLRVLKKRLES